MLYFVINQEQNRRDIKRNFVCQIVKYPRVRKLECFSHPLRFLTANMEIITNNSSVIILSTKYRIVLTFMTVAYRYLAVLSIQLLTIQNSIQQSMYMNVSPIITPDISNHRKESCSSTQINLFPKAKTAYKKALYH